MTRASTRKQSQLDICLSEDVEHGNTRLDEIHLVHKAFPELSIDQVDASTRFLSKKISAPVLISCMTGGSKHGVEINSMLASVAESLHIPLGLGSIRILFDQKEHIADFSLRNLAPSVPILANLGATQLRSIEYTTIFSMLERLAVDAIVLHINPAQELYQLGGESDFGKVLSHIRTFIDLCPLPVIVKETGYGIAPPEADVLLGYGTRYVDFAGSGGSNWAKIEQLRQRQHNAASSNSALTHSEGVFQLGHPTALLMLAYRNYSNIIASGGIRKALDVVRCLVLGAKAVGLALPIIREASKGEEAVHNYLSELLLDLKKIMLLCGAQTLDELKQVPYWLSTALAEDFAAYCKALSLTQNDKNIPPL